MLDVKRWKELRAMTENELAETAKALNLRWPAPLGIISIMSAEFRRDNPEMAARIDEAFR